MSNSIKSVLLALLLVTSGQALAYIGPGAGISVVGSLLSILATFFVAIGAILFWPIRKLLKRRKARRETTADAEPAREPDDGPGDGRRA
jgi:membrane protein implicated in regulation of membrane protease activity